MTMSYDDMRDKALREAGPVRMCNCVGPQRGQPLCPCLMHGVIVRDGRYIKPEVDLGPASAPAAGGESWTTE